MADNRDTLFTCGACLIALVAFVLAVATGWIDLTPPAPNRSPVEALGPRNTDVDRIADHVERIARETTVKYREVK